MTVGHCQSAIRLALIAAVSVGACSDGPKQPPATSISLPVESPVAAPLATPETSSLASAMPDATTGYDNPVFRNDAADPSVIRGDDGVYYAYTTQAYHDVEFVTLPILRSPDLVTWQLVGDAFAGEARPRWIVPGQGSGDVWAPHIARIGRQYLLYYASSSATTLTFGVGVATSDSPVGPFKDLGKPLLTGPGFTTIDPFVLQDGDRLYLYWGSAGDPIWAQELAPDGLSLRGKRTAVLQPSGRPYEGLIEGPWVVLKDGVYHLMYSGDSCCGANPHYAVLDARGPTPLGPFERDPANPILAANDRFDAPGHHALITDDAGTNWILYHAMDREDGSGLRLLMLDPLDWVDGWPVVNDGQGPSATSQNVPTILPAG